MTSIYSFDYRQREAMTTPSSQGPCICPECGVLHGCPRHNFMWDWVGQDPFKDHLRVAVPPFATVLTITPVGPVRKVIGT